MEFICGADREQGTFLPDRIEDYVSIDNPVRVIDAYIETLDMKNLGFKQCEPNETGRPMYAPKDLLKLYLYGYMNRVRSSRSLEIETKRNLEVIWLLKKLTPDHKTIARFRQHNARALKNVFYSFVKTCMGFGLYGQELIAVDGSKFKAWNSKDRNFSSGKLSDRITRINERIEAYLAELNETDKLEQGTADSINIEELIRKLNEREERYQQLTDQLVQSDDLQISLTDPDSRLMKTKNGMDVCLNVQTAVDAQNKMIVAFSVGSEVQDKNMLAPTVELAEQVLEKKELTVLADRGYDSVSDVAQVVKNGHMPIIAHGEYEFCLPTDDEHAEMITSYDTKIGKSIYWPEQNVFICPMGKMLHPIGYSKVKRTATYSNGAACSKCPQKCTKSKYYHAERLMPPSAYNKQYDDSPLPLRKVHIAENKQLMQQRKCIVEHPFGTVKRSLGVSYLLLKGKQKAEGEISLAFLAYNMKRAIKILGFQKLLYAFRR